MLVIFRMMIMLLSAIGETSEKGKKPECVMWSYLENKTMPLQVPFLFIIINVVITSASSASPSILDFMDNDDIHDDDDFRTRVTPLVSQMMSAQVSRAR